VRFNHVVELERPIDDRLERTPFQTLEDVFHRGLCRCRLCFEDCIP
jgi:hypothetical protein